MSPTPEHPLVSDALARATLQALLENETLGLALLRAGDWQHVLVNAAYERIVGKTSVLGRNAVDVLGTGSTPLSVLEGVVATGVTTHVAHAAVRDGRAHADLTLLRVRGVSHDGDGVLVLARDVSADVRARRIADHFISFAGDGHPQGEEAASIRTSVAHARRSLGATSASLFLLSRDRKSLHGAILGWDWTRTSFVSEVEHWPNVDAAIAANEARFFMAEDAQRVERVWFEHRSLGGVLCAPMTSVGEVIGVLFFDYATASRTAVDLAFAKDVADRCASLVERIRDGEIV